MKTEVYLNSKKMSFKEFKKRKKLDKIREANQKILDEIKEVNAQRSLAQTREQSSQTQLQSFVPINNAGW